MAPQHVPAWKKLGLKLKNAPEAADKVDGVSAASSVSAAKKRKFAGEPSGNLSNHQLAGGQKEPVPNGSVVDKRYPEKPKSEEEKSKRRRLIGEEDLNRSKEQATESERRRGSTSVEEPSAGKAPQVTQLSELNGLEGSTSSKKQNKRSRSSKHSRLDETREFVPGDFSAEHLASRENNLDQATTEGQSTVAPTSKRRKSVTFTPETKKDDGDTAQKLFKEWQRGQTGANAEFTPAQVAEFQPPPKTHPANHEPAKSTKAPSKKDKKQVKKAHREAETEAAAEPGLSPPYVTYLERYHTARDSWKFNKTQQINLLKNVFNIYRIPPKHDEALKAYLTGLKGQTARQRLRESAQALLKELNEAEPSDDQTKSIAAEDEQTEEGTMDDPAARAEAREAALRTQLKKRKQRMRDEDAAAYEQSPEFRQLYVKRRRAEYVLPALAASEAQTADLSSSNVDGSSGRRSDGKVNGVTFGPKRATHIRFDDEEEDASNVAEGTQERRKRKHPRKKRTGVPDDNNLSSVSSVESVPSPAGSEDESSSEGGCEEESEEESSTSSGSSSSSSGSSSSSSSSSDSSSSDSSDEE